MSTLPGVKRQVNGSRGTNVDEQGSPGLQKDSEFEGSLSHTHKNRHALVANARYIVRTGPGCFQFPRLMFYNSVSSTRSQHEPVSP